MGSMFGGSPAPAAAPVVAAPAPIVYQSDDPYAPNYKPPTGAQLSPAQKAAARPLAPAVPDETEAERLARLRRSALILGAGGESWGGGDGSSSGAASGVGNAGDASAAADAGTGDGF